MKLTKQANEKLEKISSMRDYFQCVSEEHGHGTVVSRKEKCL
jgi:hypothetical protein